MMSRESCPVCKALEALDSLPAGKRPAAYRLMLMILVKRIRPWASRSDGRDPEYDLMQSIGLSLHTIRDGDIEEAALAPIVNPYALEMVEQNGLDDAVAWAKSVHPSQLDYPSHISTAIKDLAGLPDLLRSMVDPDGE